MCEAGTLIMPKRWQLGIVPRWIVAKIEILGHKEI